jgi:hypothetical protein
MVDWTDGNKPKGLGSLAPQLAASFVIALVLGLVAVFVFDRVFQPKVYFGSVRLSQSSTEHPGRTNRAAFLFPYYTQTT